MATTEANGGGAAVLEADRVVMIPAAKLRRHPLNPRPDPTEGEVAGLMESIAATGQHQPCLVRPVRAGRADVDGEGVAAAGAGDYELVVGHRRAKACALLGLEVSCVVQPMNDDEALAVMLADNLQRTDPDPISEAGAVVELMKVDGMDFRAVAAVLGKSVGWVATRTVLAKLDPDVAHELKSRRWPIACLEEYARLAPDAQRAFLKECRWCDSLEDLRRFLGNRFRELGKATWDLDDGNLLPAAGPCSTCPKQSLHTPGLFEDEPEGNADLKLARCRDAVCWAAKACAVQALAVAKIREENPDALVLDQVHGHVTDLEKRYPALKGAKVEVGANFETEPKKFVGAVPAVLLEEDGGVRKAWARPHGWAPETSKAAAKKAKAAAGEPADRRSDAQKLKDSRALIGTRRTALLVDLVSAAVEKLEAPAPKVVIALVGGYEVKELLTASGMPYWGNDGRKRRAEGVALYEKDPKAWAAAVWPRVRKPVLKALDRRVPTDLEGQADEARGLAGLLGIDLAALEAETVKKVPNPKWWPAPRPAGGCYCDGKIEHPKARHTKSSCTSPTSGMSGPTKPAPKKKAAPKAARASKAPAKKG